MFKNFIATLSYIKNKPSLFHNYLLPDIKPAVKIFVYLRRILQIKDYFSRKKLANKYKENKILNQQGFLNLQNKSLKNNLQKISKRIFKEFNKQDLKDLEKKSRKPFLINKSIDLSEKKNLDILLLIMNKNIIGPISKYLNQIPILIDASIMYSPNKIFEKGRSQEYHLDGEDLKQIKLWIPLKKIDKNNGPLTVIKKIDSNKIYKELFKIKCKKALGIPLRNQKLEDKIVLKNKPTESKLIGDQKNIFFVDTSNCYHYGSRPSKNSKPRFLLSLHFITNQSRVIPLWNKKVNVLEELKIKKFKIIENNKIFQKIFEYYVINKNKKFYRYSG